MSSEFVVYLISLRPAYREWIDRQICPGLVLYHGQSVSYRNGESHWTLSETCTVKILSKLLFDNLQAQSRESARLNAEVAALESSRKINCGGRGDCPPGAGSPDAVNRRGRSTNRTQLRGTPWPFSATTR